MKIKTPANLKYWHQKLDPDSNFFARDTMKFFGDTLSNYRVVNHGKLYELQRKNPVKNGLKGSAYFTVDTLSLVVNESKIKQLLEN